MLWPHEDGDLSRFMQWLLISHVRRYHRHYGGSGHVWQGRFKAFPIEHEHLLAVLRYVEGNPLRANLVRRAEDWRWSSLASQGEWLHPGLVARGEGWTQWVKNRVRLEMGKHLVRAKTTPASSMAPVGLVVGSLARAVLCDAVPR